MPTDHDDLWLENAIRSLPEVNLPPDLARRVAQIPIEHSQGFAWPNFGGLRMFASWAVCAALGLACGSFIDMSTLSTPIFSADPSVDTAAEDPMMDLVARAWTFDSEAGFDSMLESDPALENDPAESFQ